MTARPPWPAAGTAAITSYQAALPGAASAPIAARARWLTPDGAAVAAAPVPDCPGCAELKSLRASIAAARDEASAHGRRDGLAETAAARALLAAAAAAIDRAAAAREDAVAEQVVELALGLCAELAPAAAAIDRRALVQLIARSLADAGSGSELVVQVCADDAAAVGTQLPAGLACSVRADLVPGEVWVDAPRLFVDGRWATRLAALREPLIALVHAAEPSFELADPTSGADGEP